MSEKERVSIDIVNDNSSDRLVIEMNIDNILVYEYSKSGGDFIVELHISEGCRVVKIDAKIFLQAVQESIRALEDL